MKTNIKKKNMKKTENSSTGKILLGGTAAALALTTLNKNKWRYPIFGLAGWKLWKGFSGGSEDEIPYDAVPENSKSAMVQGLRMRWEEHGEESDHDIPVIMVHGLPTNPRVWRYVIPQISTENVRCLAWEQVGFGQSAFEGLGLDISIPKQAEYLYDWLQHMDITKAIFVAHDYGGGVVQQLVANHPEVAAGLVFSDVVAYENWPVPTMKMARSLRKGIEHVSPDLLKPVLHAGVTTLGHDNKAIAEESFELYWKPYNNVHGPRAFSNQLQHLHSEDTERASEQLENMDLNIPTRVIWGEEDKLSNASGKRLANAFSAPFIQIPGGKHFTIEDHPAVIAQAIDEVISEVE